MAIKIITIVFLFILTFSSYGQKKAESDYLIRFADPISDTYGYKNPKGDTIIPLGRYPLCFTDTFRIFAIVHTRSKGFVAIDRGEKELYSVFVIDNGPDYPSEGLFRIVDNSGKQKIGYANSITGEVVIKPQFSCAFPFKNGIAKVSENCRIEPIGEYSKWVSDSWYYIDKTGKKVEAFGSQNP